MQICEIFYSIQGEGLWSGIPAVFIRTAGCNLRCNGCDTPYALKEDVGQQMSIEAILAAISKYDAHHCVITGGEPMIALDMRELTIALRHADFQIGIETNCTIAPCGVICDLVSLNPKLPLSSLSDPAEVKNTDAQPNIICEWIDDYAYQLKFVVGSIADVAKVQTLVDKLKYQIPVERILLMPMTVRGEYVTPPTDVVEWCKKYGYRYCNRLQVELYGERRGV